MCGTRTIVIDPRGDASRNPLEGVGVKSDTSIDEVTAPNSDKEIVAAKTKESIAAGSSVEIVIAFAT